LISRQALHAHTIAFMHPRTGKRVALEAPIPPDITRLIDALQATAPSSVPKKGRF